MKSLKKILILAMCLLTFSCSEAGPDLEDINLALTNHLASKHYYAFFELGEIDIKLSRKINDDCYSLSLDYALIAKQDLNHVLEQAVMEIEQGFDQLMAESAYKMHYGNFEPGDVIRKVDSILLVRTGETWRVNR